MKLSKELFIKDYERYTPNKYHAVSGFFRILKSYELRFYWLGRKYGACKTKFGLKFMYMVMEHYRKKYSLEINWKNIGGGCDSSILMA